MNLLSVLSRYTILPALRFLTRIGRGTSQPNAASFELTDNNPLLVVDICRKLDDIALAIELTSTRVVVFSLTQLSAVLDDRFQLLYQGRRSVLSPYSPQH